MATFVLVHGAWQGAWVWDAVADNLRRYGHHVLALDLPGHGSDRTPLEEVTMNAYAEKIAAAVSRLQDVILVGHSMGGAAISAAAELQPVGLQRLIYVCAFLPRTGDSVMSLAAMANENSPQVQLDVSQDGLAATVTPPSIIDNFMHDCDVSVIVRNAQKFQAQALQPLNARIQLSATGFGQYPRDYIVCSEDRAVSADLQRLMLEATPCKRVAVLSSSHSPYASQPEALADLLHEWA